MKSCFCAPARVGTAGTDTEGSGQWQGAQVKCSGPGRRQQVPSLGGPAKGLLGCWVPSGDGPFSSTHTHGPALWPLLSAPASPLTQAGPCAVLGQAGTAHLLPLPGPIPSSPAWLTFSPPWLPKAGLELGPSGKTPSPEGAVERKRSAAVFPPTGLWLPGDTAGSWCLTGGLTLSSVLYSDICIHTSTTCIHVRGFRSGPRPVSWVLLQPPAPCFYRTTNEEADRIISRKVAQELTAAKWQSWPPNPHV